MKISRHAMEVFLLPGELWFDDDETRIRTILGPCVAVTLWHPARKIGGTQRDKLIFWTKGIVLCSISYPYGYIHKTNVRGSHVTQGGCHH